VEQPEQSDGYAAAGALLGLAAGFVIARLISLRQARSRFQPYIARPLREEQGLKMQQEKRKVSLEHYFFSHVRRVVNSFVMGGNTC